MKRLLLLLLTVAATLSVGAATDKPFVVRTTNGDITFQIPNVSHVSFGSDGSVTVTPLNGTPSTVSADRLVSLRFDNTVGVGSVTSDQGVLTVQDGNVLSTIAGIAIYDISGRKVTSTPATELSLQGLGRGIYIARSGRQTLKLTVK